MHRAVNTIGATISAAMNSKPSNEVLPLKRADGQGMRLDGSAAKSGLGLEAPAESVTDYIWMEATGAKITEFTEAETGQRKRPASAGARPCTGWKKTRQAD